MARHVTRCKEKLKVTSGPTFPLKTFFIADNKTCISLNLKKRRKRAIIIGIKTTRRNINYNRARYKLNFHDLRIIFDLSFIPHCGLQRVTSVQVIRVYLIILPAIQRFYSVIYLKTCPSMMQVNKTMSKTFLTDIAATITGQKLLKKKNAKLCFTE